MSDLRELYQTTILDHHRQPRNRGRLEHPTGSGKQLTLREVAGDLADRLVGIWLPDHQGRRPVHGAVELLQTDPAWRDNPTFNEYFHGDLGIGLGATHQTGWTALVVDLLLDPPGESTRLVGGRRARAK